MKISVVINTYNAEKLLDKVLASVKGVDEILICDMHSTDSTLAIARAYGATIIYHEKTAFVEPARNFAIAAAKNEWVLLLDADETVGPQLVPYLEKLVTSQPEICAVALARKNYFMGRFMRAAYPDQGPRFFKKQAVYWPPHIHSAPVISGPVVKIDSRHKELAINHLANDTVAEILHKNNVYSTAAAAKNPDKKTGNAALLFSPLFWFIKFYFIKGGILDGRKGFLFAVLKAQYKFSVLAKQAEARHKA